MAAPGTGVVGFMPAAVAAPSIRPAGAGRAQHPHDPISPGAAATELPNSMTEPDVAENIHKPREAFAIFTGSSGGRSPWPSASPRRRT
jgi:hypothetical protein